MATIPIAQLKQYHLYRGKGRNFDLAVWYGRMFHGLRKKWHENYVDPELHGDEPSGGTFSPHEDLGSLEARLSPACFSPHEWRAQTALHDMLFCAEVLVRHFGGTPDQEAQGHEEQH